MKPLKIHELTSHEWKKCNHFDEAGIAPVHPSNCERCAGTGNEPVEVENEKITMQHDSIPESWKLRTGEEFWLIDGMLMETPTSLLEAAKKLDGKDFKKFLTLRPLKEGDLSVMMVVKI